MSLAIQADDGRAESARSREDTIARLRLLTAAPKRSGLPCPRVSSGIPRGAVTEISGAHGGGKTRLVLDFLAENPKLRVAWVEDEMSIYPRAFPQSRVSLARVLFVEAGEHLLWAAHQALRSGLFGVVVLALGLAVELEQTDLRRLQLGAERAAAAVIILTESATNTGSWPIAVQLDVNRNSVRRLK